MIILYYILIFQIVVSKGVNLNYTVGVSDFVTRQVKNTGKTYSSLSFKEIASYAEKKLNEDNFRDGYRDGVVIVNVESHLIDKFICPFIKINDSTKLKAEVSKRRDNEESYIRIKAKNGISLKTESVDIILYHNDVLKETNEQSTNTDWELISFHAIPEGINNMPMGPVTMMRNQLELKGGTKGKYTSEEWAESVKFWQGYAIKE